MAPLNMVVVSAEVANEFKDLWKVRKETAKEAKKEIAATYRWVNSRGEEVSPPPLNDYVAPSERDSSNIRKVSAFFLPAKYIFISLHFYSDTENNIYQNLNSCTFQQQKII